VVLCKNGRVKNRFIDDHHYEHGIATVCRVLHVSRSGFYHWLHEPHSDRAIKDQRVPGLIRASYVASGGVYGALRVFPDLRETSKTRGKHRVDRTVVSGPALGQCVSMADCVFATDGGVVVGLMVIAMEGCGDDKRMAGIRSAK